MNAAPIARCVGCSGRTVFARRAAPNFYDGAICSRCDLDLDDWGYCPNDRCPFFARHQDEGGVDDEPVMPEEKEYIERVVLPGLTGGQPEPGGET